MSRCSTALPETLKAMEGRSRRLGVGIDTGQWAQDGVNVRDGVTRVKDRLLYVQPSRPLGPRRQRAERACSARGVANLREFFAELGRQDDREISIRLGGDGSPVVTTRVPIAMTLDTTGVVKAPGDLFAAVSAFEDAVQPAYAVNFLEFSRTRPIRFDRRHAVARRDAGAGRDRSPGGRHAHENRRGHSEQAVRVAEEGRGSSSSSRASKGMSHNTIPLTNVMIQRMGEKTGAWTTVFSNDLSNLRYPKVKEYDAIFLNSIVGEFLPDPAMRADLVRYVNEGGGIGGIHGTPWASRNWDEFAEMIGAQSAPHRIENGVLKVYDKDNPIVARRSTTKICRSARSTIASRIRATAALRWDKVRVLLIVDLDEKVPNSTDKPWQGYRRPDKVYPVAWIREYGKGRVFYNSMGHMTETFMRPEIVGHFLVGMQYILGDVDANATPNPLK